MSLVIIGDAVRLRAGPGTEHAIVAELDAGTIAFPMTEYGWREVVTEDGIGGWVAVEYIREGPDLTDAS